MAQEVEENLQLTLDFGKLKKAAALDVDLIPAIAQDADTGAVLIVGYADRQALEATLSKRLAVFYSTSRDSLWVKGETSGDYLDLVEVRVNCEQNALLYLVRPRSGRGACHTRDGHNRSRKTCFYRSVEDARSLAFLPYLK